MRASAGRRDDARAGAARAQNTGGIAWVRILVRAEESVATPLCRLAPWWAPVVPLVVLVVLIATLSTPINVTVTKGWTVDDGLVSPPTGAHYVGVSTLGGAVGGARSVGGIVGNVTTDFPRAPRQYGPFEDIHVGETTFVLLRYDLQGDACGTQSVLDAEYFVSVVMLERAVRALPGYTDVCQLEPIDPHREVSEAAVAARPCRAMFSMATVHQLLFGTELPLRAQWEQQAYLYKGVCEGEMSRVFLGNDAECTADAVPFSHHLRSVVLFEESTSEGDMLAFVERMDALVRGFNGAQNHTACALRVSTLAGVSLAHEEQTRVEWMAGLLVVTSLGIALGTRRGVLHGMVVWTSTMWALLLSYALALASGGTLDVELQVLGPVLVFVAVSIVCGHLLGPCFAPFSPTRRRVRFSHPFRLMASLFMCAGLFTLFASGACELRAMYRVSAFVGTLMFTFALVLLLWRAPLDAMRARRAAKAHAKTHTPGPAGEIELGPLRHGADGGSDGDGDDSDAGEKEEEAHEAQEETQEEAQEEEEEGDDQTGGGSEMDADASGAKPGLLSPLVIGLEPHFRARSVDASNRTRVVGGWAIFLLVFLVLATARTSSQLAPRMAPWYASYISTSANDTLMTALDGFPPPTLSSFPVTMHLWPVEESEGITCLQLSAALAFYNRVLAYNSPHVNAVERGHFWMEAFTAWKGGTCESIADVVFFLHSTSEGSADRDNVRFSDDGMRIMWTKIKFASAVDEVPYTLPNPWMWRDIGRNRVFWDDMAKDGLVGVARVDVQNVFIDWQGRRDAAAHDSVLVVLVGLVGLMCAAGLALGSPLLTVGVFLVLLLAYAAETRAANDTTEVGYAMHPAFALAMVPFVYMGVATMGRMWPHSFAVAPLYPTGPFPLLEPLFVITVALWCASPMAMVTIAAWAEVFQHVASFALFGTLAGLGMVACTVLGLYTWDVLGSTRFARME